MPTSLIKFDSHRDELLAAVRGLSDLRSNRRLYKKVHKFYKSEGVIFTGDANVDYNILVNLLIDDIYVYSGIQ